MAAKLSQAMDVRELRWTDRCFNKLFSRITVEDIEKIKSKKQCDELIKLIDNQLQYFIPKEKYESLNLVVLDDLVFEGDYFLNVNKYYGIWEALPIIREIYDRHESNKYTAKQMLKIKEEQVEKIAKLKERYKDHIHEQNEGIDGPTLIAIDQAWEQPDENLYNHMTHLARILYDDRLHAGYLIKERGILIIAQNIYNDLNRSTEVIAFNEDIVNKVSNYLTDNSIIDKGDKVRIRKLMSGESISPNKIQFKKSANLLSKLFWTLYHDKLIDFQKKKLAEWLCENFQTYYKSEFATPAQQYIYKGLTTQGDEKFKYLSKNNISL